MADKDSPNRKQIARMGGDARSKALSSTRKSEIAKGASLARWGDGLPYALKDGDLVIAERRIACAVLNTHKRVLTQETFMTAIGRAAKPKAGTGSRGMQVDDLPPFLAAENLKPFVSDELRQSTTPILFRTKTGIKAYGYDAMLLPNVCEVYLRARDAHLMDRKAGHLLQSQVHIVQACDLLMRGLARVGIIALIDKATGFEDQVAQDELLKILEQYITPSLMPWTKRFGDEFFKQIFRLHGWTYKPGNTRRPQYVGHFINKYIYDQLPEGVLGMLREINPVMEDGRRKFKHTRHLRPTGNEHLDRQLTAVTTLMEVSDTKEEFKRMFQRIARPGTVKELIVKVDPPTKELDLFPGYKPA